MKKLIAMLVAVSTVLAFASCGNEDKTSSSQKSNDTSVQSKEDETLSSDEQSTAESSQLGSEYYEDQESEEESLPENVVKDEDGIIGYTFNREKLDNEQKDRGAYWNGDKTLSFFARNIPLWDAKNVKVDANAWWESIRKNGFLGIVNDTFDYKDLFDEEVKAQSCEMLKIGDKNYDKVVVKWPDKKANRDVTALLYITVKEAADVDYSGNPIPVAYCFIAFDNTENPDLAKMEEMLKMPAETFQKKTF